MCFKDFEQFYETIHYWKNEKIVNDVKIDKLWSCLQLLQLLTDNIIRHVIQRYDLWNWKVLQGESKDGILISFKKTQGKLGNLSERYPRCKENLRKMQRKSYNRPAECFGY